MNRTLQYIREHVYFRCGHAVSRLCDAGLLARPETTDSESEINEWWLVSEELAGRLHSAGLPVLQFYEMHMWGRAAARVPLKDDLDLARVLPADARS